LGKSEVGDVSPDRFIGLFQHRTTNIDTPAALVFSRQQAIQRRRDGQRTRLVPDTAPPRRPDSGIPAPRSPLLNRPIFGRLRILNRLAAMHHWATGLSWLRITSRVKISFSLQRAAEAKFLPARMRQSPDTHALHRADVKSNRSTSVNMTTTMLNSNEYKQSWS
jgi:hypothetical protein